MSNKYRAERRAKREYRLPRIPMMPALKDQFGMQMHTALQCLEMTPSSDTFDSLAEVFNVVQVAIEHDAKRQHEARLINGGAMALNQAQRRICAGVVPHDYEIAPIRVAVNTIDSIMGKLDVLGLYTAMMKRKTIKATTC